MTESWTIDPTTVNGETIINNNNGEFIFPSNTGTTPLYFTIIYSIDGVEKARTQYVLKNGEDCKPCNFSIATATKLGCEGGTAAFTKVANK